MGELWNTRQADAVCAVLRIIICINQVTRMNGSCYTYECVMPHTWLNGWVMSSVRMSLVSHMIESCYTYKWVMSHSRTNEWNTSHMAGECCLSCLERFLNFINKNAYIQVTYMYAHVFIQSDVSGMLYWLVLWTKMPVLYTFWRK